MAEETDFLSLFEGLNSQQAKELRKRIIPTLQSVRDEITQQTGENKMTLNLNEIFASLDDDEIRNVLEGLSTVEQVELYRSLAQKTTPPVGRLSVEEQFVRNGEQLRTMYKDKSKHRTRIAELEMENDAMLPILEEHLKQAQQDPSRDLQVRELEGQREGILEELGRYQKFPSKYRARMQELYKEQSEIDEKIQMVKA